MQNQTMKKQRGNRWRRIVLVALVLATLVSLSVVWWTIAADEPTVHVVFSDGGYRESIKEDYAPTELFDDFSLDATFTSAGCLIIPGTDFATATSGKLNIAAENTVDPETFYFDEAVNGEPRWAYTFTGWQVKGTTQRIPAQTVFQSGDAVTPDVLEKLAEQGFYTVNGDGSCTVELEAVWGRCYFIRNPFDKMLYSQHASYGWYPDLDASLTYAQGKGLNPNGAYSSDANLGNDPALPKATVDSLFGVLRTEIYTDKTVDAGDAYATVVMLVGDLDYYKDTSKGDVYYGFLTGGAANKSKAFISTTYKSRQAAGDPATGYHYNLKQKQYSNTMYSNMRFDNINLLKYENIYSAANPEATTRPSSASTEFMFTRVSAGTFHYFEATARFGQKLPSGRAWGISTFRPTDYNVVSLNGGSFGTWQTTYSSSISRVNGENKLITWYFGRKAAMSGAITCGTTSNYDYTVHTVYADFQLNVTGGSIATVYGGSAGSNSICVGNREINVYGNDAGSYGQYEPKITSLYGGSDRARFFGVLNVNLYHSTQVKDLYGGGNYFSATTFGNINISLDHSTLQGNLFGGGKNGNTEVIPETYVQYTYSKNVLSSAEKSTATDLKVPIAVGTGGKVTINLENGSVVKGNVYGSGMGSSQTMLVTDRADDEAVPTDWYNTNYYPSGWTEPLTSYPSFRRDTMYILIGAERRISWSEYTPTGINFYSDNTLAYLSLATVQDVEINITDSTVGTAPNLATGNVYGGGSIAKVLGSTEINVTNSTVYGNVYGGGDGTTQPDRITLYYPLTGLAGYKSPTYTVTSWSNSLPAKVSITARSHAYNDKKLDASFKYPQTFAWSGETYLLSEEYNGIDYENYLLYSANTERWGSVENNTSVTIDGAKTSIKGAVYGGGNNGEVLGSTKVRILNGTVNEVYAGCNQSDVFGDTTLQILGGEITSAYGGNNQSGSIAGDVSVSMSGGDVTALLGGGNLAGYRGTATVTVNGGSVGTLYGGGKEAAVNETVVNILGTAEIDNAYGGGDEGPVRTNCSITLSETASVGILYGGANAADIDGDVTLTLQSGRVTGELFGANNQSGVISGEVTVQVQGGETETLYGGGNHADYHGTADVSLSGGRFGMVYGGGKVAAVERVELTVGGVLVSGSLYGGGYQGDVLSDAVVILAGCEIVGGLYGGGYNGNVAGTTTLRLTDATVGGSLYGGGYQGNVDGFTNIDVQAIELAGNLYGGGYAGTVGGTAVSINDTVFGAGAILIEGSVFGGGEGSTATVLGSSSVDVNMAIDFTATEVSSDTDSETPSGASSLNEHITVPVYSKILGDVFGGGDLGQVGDGRIIQSSNTAQVSVEGFASVTLRNGYIGGSVFGGGSGVPKDGQTYNVKMGTVFGSTRTNIYGGYIEGSVYGGGTQSRVYAASASAIAACVSIDQTQPDSLQKILIGGSVFSGGDRGTKTTQNASVPTTIGNVQVNITGAPGDVASDIYFRSGGIYGDGNLCLVRGTRSITIKDYHTDQHSTLKTFYSLQRADEVTLDNSRIVLLGAIDLVEEGDYTVYSVNRVGKLLMKNGSTVKLDQIVKYLGELESSVETERVFVDRGNNASNNYVTHGGDAANTNALTEREILDYQDLGSERNTVCVANGLYLRIESEMTKSLGPVKGLFTLSLLRAKVGEGGGFVYASIPLSTGAFICETFMDGDKKYNAVEIPSSEAFEQGIYYVAVSSAEGTDYVRADGTYDAANTTYYTKNYMKVVGDVGGFSGDAFTYYYWYINGATIHYTTGITGYIGSMETRYSEVNSIPPHAKQLHYVLNSIEGNSTLKNAVIGAKPTYQLLKSVSFDGEGKPILADQQIAIEVRLGSRSLGFVWYDESSDTWYLCQSGKDFAGYNEHKEEIGNNVLLDTTISVDTTNSDVELVFYKSTEVNAELAGMTLDIVIDIYFDNGEGIPGNVFNEGANKLMFQLRLAVERLMPEQTLFYQPGESYGVATTIDISITGQSAFTAQYKTRYIPTAFPAAGGMGMRWVLSTASYDYYMDPEGNYMTLDGNGDCVNITGHLIFNDSLDPSTMTLDTYPEWTVMKRADGTYFYKAEDANGSRILEFSLEHSVRSPKLPKGTKITMIDISPGINPTFYYYLCKESTESVDVLDFALMGSTQSIRDGGVTPAFMQLYVDEFGKQISSRITEEILFIFDFSAADWGGLSLQDCTVEFKHFYGNSTSGVDIMDYVSIQKNQETNVIQSIEREFARPTPYLVYPDTNGLDQFVVEIEEQGDDLHPEYYDYDSLTLNLDIVENPEKVNTVLSEETFVLRMSLVNGGVERKLPVGIRVEVDGHYFYPAPGNMYILVRVDGSGAHKLIVESYLASMKEAFGVGSGGEIQLRFSLYCAQYDENSNALTVAGAPQGNTVCVDTYKIHDNPIYSMAVSADVEDRMIGAGEIFRFAIATGVVGDEIAPVHPTVSVSRKSETTGKYETVATNSLFITATNIAKDGSFEWRTSPRAAKGTYRLAFTYGDRVEYLTLVIE